MFAGFLMKNHAGNGRRLCCRRLMIGEGCELINNHGIIALRLTKDNYTIEIHNRIFPGTDVTDEVVESAKIIEIDGVPTYIPDIKLNKKFLLLHLEKHRRNGEYPIRLYADLEIIEPGSAPEVPDEFIFNPVQHRSISIKNIRSTLITSSQIMAILYIRRIIPLTKMDETEI